MSWRNLSCQTLSFFCFSRFSLSSRVIFYTEKTGHKTKNVKDEDVIRWTTPSNALVTTLNSEGANGDLCHEGCCWIWDELMEGKWEGSCSASLKRKKFGNFSWDCMVSAIQKGGNDWRTKSWFKLTERFSPPAKWIFNLIMLNAKEPKTKFFFQIWSFVYGQTMRSSNFLTK